MQGLTANAFALFTFKALIVLNVIEYIAKVVTGPAITTFEHPEFQNILLLGLVVQLLSDKTKQVALHETCAGK